MSGPVAGPLASSQMARKAAPDAGLREIRMPKDCPSPVSFRISSPRLDLIASQLTPTDQAVVALVARARLCSGAQLEQLFWHHGRVANRARQARRVLARLVSWRLLDRLPRMIGGRRAGSRGFIYTLGPAGARLLARQQRARARRLIAPGDRYIKHTLAISGLYADLVVGCREGKASLLAFEFEPQCWTQFPGPWATTLTLKPDASVRLGIGEYEYSWLVEIDQATESLPTIESKARRHLDYYRSGTPQRATGVAPRVLWVAPNEIRAAAITETLDHLPAEAARLFAITTATRAAAMLTEGDRT